MTNKIGDAQFHVMCEMWGVDQAVESVWEMGMSVTNEQIEKERHNEEEHDRYWNNVLKRLIMGD